MNATQTHVLSHEEELALKWTGYNSMLEALSAIAVIALAIVGLAGVFSTNMAAIAAIVLGGALMIEGGTLAAVSERFHVRTGEEALAAARAPMLGIDFLGGVAGVVLGILALLGVDPITLVSVATIVFGASFLMINQPVLGLAGIVLGILAVIGLASLSLVLVAFLALGAGALIGGAGTATKALTTQPA